MARIVFGGYLVRFPLGGVLSVSLQWLLGLQKLGHEVFVVEKSGWSRSCFDPCRGVLTDDCSYGVGVVDALLTRFGLEDRWCYVDAAGHYHGQSRSRVEAVCASADLYLDRGSQGAWLEETAGAAMRVLIDVDPAYTQIKMEHALALGATLPEYDRHYTVGLNVGTPASSSPTVGRVWHSVYNPVDVELVDAFLPVPGAAFTTVMNWRAHHEIEWAGRTYGQKDVEFQRFIDLPARTGVPLEVAVAGTAAPTQALVRGGWRVRDAHAVTVSLDSYLDYIRSSRGEFSACKEVFVATRTGWFSDRSAVYLASGRPVVLQDTGFSDHLPCGEGLFAVRTVEAAAAAIEEVEGDYDRHSRRAREIAVDCLDVRVVLRRFLDGLGL